MYSIISRWTLEELLWKSGWNLWKGIQLAAVHAVWWQGDPQARQDVLGEVVHVDRVVVPSFDDEGNGVNLRGIRDGSI
jgi:hypothetical protein